MNISPDAEFNEILDILNEISVSNPSVQLEQIIYAILELLNNSLRAHRELGSTKKIHLVFLLEGNYFSVRLQDWGGGFDPKVLPFDIEANIEDIDINGSDFVAYREKNGYRRFGMGFYIVRKTFSRFRLSFRDTEGRETSWEKGKTAGTCIDLSLEVS
jgi:anti-sigma regulatory factor (Ser/Thr protein kinase)